MNPNQIVFQALAIFLTLFYGSICRAAADDVAATQVTQGETLTSGQAALVVSADKQTATSVKISLAIAGNGTAAFSTGEPLNIELLDRAGTTAWLAGRYATVVHTPTALQCTGEIKTPSGTVFNFADIYTATKNPGPFLLSRIVTVSTPSANDKGFTTRFSLHDSDASPLRDREIFIPGLCYINNKNVPASSLIPDLSADYMIVREDRMPLPLVMMRNKQTGVAITLIHSSPDGSTTSADYAGLRVVDARIQVASLGIYSQQNPAVALYYPASEGQRSQLRIDSRGNGWAERFHPVQANIKHAYTILIDIDQQKDFPTTMRHAWRTAFENIHPPVAKTDVSASYAASIKLIADWSKTTNGAAGLPFRLYLPKGQLENVSDINYQMGFVGQQLPLAYHLLRYGLMNKDPVTVSKGEAMVDFWAANSLTPDGLPRTWYDTYPQPHWRQYNTFMRVASDGMAGALAAWDVMQHYGHPKPAWLQFCKGFGDWLVTHQNDDGSWYREYDFNSKPVDLGKQNTTHPIRFMVDLYKATGDKKYRDSALRAGEWSYPNVHQAFSYIGGTADHPNVIDKEAGFIAIDAFLALHDMTGDQRWLNAAAQAADFTETWTYSWRIPIPADDRDANFPKGAATTGFSIIAIDGSGADLFMAGAPFSYYRLYLETGDVHYADFARQLLYDTKQAVDIDGSLGYGHTGLCTEALSLAPPRGHGVNVWLPWLTYSMIDPITKLQDTFGMMDMPTVQGSRLDELRAKDAEFAASRGLFAGRQGGRQ